jgi:hypothetical protein
MTKYALLLERKQRESGFQRTVSIEIPRSGSSKHEIFVSCAIVGEPSGYYGKSKTFSDETTLRVALNEARVANVEVITAIQTAVSGYKGFAYITYDNAQSLGLLEGSPH